MHIKVLGVWVSTVSGNTFSPAIQLNRRSFTIRTSHNMETTISWFKGLRWNSDHIALWLGKRAVEGEDFNGYSEAYRYKGILGEHTYI
ncbi:hypothetical protein NIES4071_103660 (plasmid) [Calothrix sp. NIES-4071]|nr:hypothetical protein NIES4071_103660 [Calothrix sp. NIES-4071]BAZ64353.1 hypothetical protein NIES4105_100860 [Calothrix sp. NIES-4105]